jgi:hypothetical protein
MAVLVWTAAGSLTATYAGEPRYNPDHLSDPQIMAVEQICQSALGLSAAEGSRGEIPLPINPHLVPGTTHYQGCVASLSDSLQQAIAGGGNTTLATIQAAASRAGVAGQPRAIHPFFYARARDVRRREDAACTAIGLEPESAAFTSCVLGLQRTFFAIDNPID